MLGLFRDSIRHVPRQWSMGELLTIRGTFSALIIYYNEPLATTLCSFGLVDEILTDL